MGMDAKTGFTGLVTATGAVAADRGALRVADNVTLRKEGALTPRATFGSTALSRQYAAAFPYKGLFYYVTASNGFYNPSQSQLGWTGDGANPLPSVYPAAVRADIQSAKEARGNLYFATALGVYKVTPTGGALLTAGAYPTDATVAYAQGVVLGGTELLPANSQVAYRAVMVRTDNNGVTTRSRPSGAIVVTTAATPQTPSVTIYPSWRNASHFTEQKVELYRTRIFPAGVTMDDEFQLIAIFTRGAMVVSGPLVSISPINYNDRVADTARTTTLYTSPSRGGVENANDRPPGAACIERFRGSLFFGNIVGPQRIVFSYNAAGDATGTATGIGSRATTGSNAAGATSITGLASTTGVRVGQLVFTQTSAGGQTVTAIAGTTVTVSSALANAQTNQPVYFVDAVSVDGVPIQLGTGTRVAWGAYQTTSGGLSNSFVGTLTAYELTPPVAGFNTTVVLEAISRGGSPMVIKASRGDEMTPAIPLSTAGTGLSTTNDVIPNGLMWTEPDEPEHCPPKNFARVGDAGKAILALVATKDRLLIFKEDGLFMLTGDTAKNFGLYPLDTTAMCILPGSVTRLQNTVYALTNLGLIAVDQSGSVHVVSRAIQTELAPIVTQIRQSQQSTGLYQMPGLSGHTGTADDPNGEYWLMLGTTTPSFGGQVLVYNAFRDGFTTYSFGTPTPVAVSRDGAGQPLVLTASSLLTPSTSLGAVTARVSPHPFSDPALVGKLWTHLALGFSRLTGTTSVTVNFSSSESMVDGTTLTEALEVPTAAGLIQLPLGSLLRHPLPRAIARAFLAAAEVVIAVSNGTFTLEFIATESRPNIPNKLPSHGTGAS